MKALAALSKFLGLYDRWKLMLKKYSLKWAERNSTDTFNKIIKSNENLDTYLSWIKSFINDDKTTRL